MPPDDNIYEGEFKDDQMHGVGKIHYSREDVIYEGLFKNGETSNIGKCTFKNENTVYIGELDGLQK